MPISPQADMRCPTCGARQSWADTCRRCKCDLRLLLAAAGAYEQHRQRCLMDLIGGPPESALRHARTCHSLRPGRESLRLIALCELRRQNWADAWQAAQAAVAVAVADEDGLRR